MGLGLGRATSLDRRQLIEDIPRESVVHSSEPKELQSDLVRSDFFQLAGGPGRILTSLFTSGLEAREDGELGFGEPDGHARVLIV